MKAALRTIAMLLLLNEAAVFTPADAMPLKRNKADIKLNSFPMIMSHDAATGEIVEARDHVVNDWAQTQSVGLTGQLDCGSRSFDYRPYCTEDGAIIAHHGGVKVHKPMSESITEVSGWCNKNPEDLVVMYITSWDGEPDCGASSQQLLVDRGIYTITNCDDLSTLTYSQAQQLGALSEGGSLIAVVNCMTEQYDSTLNCYGRTENKEKFACYDDSRGNNTTSIAWDPFLVYMTEATGTDLTASSPNLWMAQAHWQSTALSITMGTLHRSSLLLDVERSGMNKWVENNVALGAFPYLNMLEVDNVCENGPQIYNAITATYFL